jgi:hypothetical protein
MSAPDEEDIPVPSLPLILEDISVSASASAQGPDFNFDLVWESDKIDSS